MTDSDQVAYVWPTEPPPGPEWKQVAGYSDYEWSHRGRVRSIDRTRNGRSHRGVPLKTRLNNSGYVIVNVTSDARVKGTVLVHRMILRAHAGEPGPGEETLHGPGGQTDNRWPENIRYGSHPVNVAERVAAQPPREPKPRTPCVNHELCGGYVSRGGRRCHECVVQVGRTGAALLADGTDLEQAADALGYSSPAGVYKLAVKYGGLRVYVDQTAVTAGEPVANHGESQQSWLRRVINRWKTWLADSDAQ